MTEIRLEGCRTSPMASYLKALGVLRLVAEQADSDIKGWWRDGVFHIITRLSKNDIFDFLLNDYQPSPVFNPWGGRSGFYPETSEKSAREALEIIEKSDSERMRPFRETIKEVKEMLERLGFLKKPETEEEKLLVMRACRSLLPDRVLPWLDAVFLLSEGSRQFPPLLGTGGNEGSGSYTSNFAQISCELFFSDTKPKSLEASLFNPAMPGVNDTQSPGQFDPAAGGGANAGAGYAGQPATNLWDYMLAIEGCLTFAATATRKYDRSTPGSLSFPFTVKASMSGSGGAARNDEQKSRGETWLPVWPNPSRFTEVRNLLSEGRVEVGRRRARNGLDFARAVSRLGVDRGIESFVRYGYLERIGLNIGAVPLETWPVSLKPKTNLLDDIEQWLDRFRRAATSKNAPASFARALNDVENGVFAVCRRPAPQPWQGLLIALGGADAAMVKSPKSTLALNLRPVPRLTAQWAVETDDGSAEFGLAFALASLKAVKTANKAVLPAMRGYMVPLDLDKPYPVFRENLSGKETVWGQAGLIENLIRVLVRRLTDARQGNIETPPLSAHHPASTTDIVRFLSGDLDYTKIEDLLWGLNSVDLREAGSPGLEEREYTVPPAYYSLLKLSLAHRLFTGQGEAVEVPIDPAMIHLALAGRMDKAVSLAAKRLRSAGFTPLVDRGFVLDRIQARRATAALMIPVAPGDLKRMLFDVTRASGI